METDPTLTQERGGPPPVDELPLSVLQEAMWVSWQLRPQAWEHIVPFTLRVRGHLDTDRLRAALDEVGRVHPMLRGRVVTAPDGGSRLSWAAAPPIPLLVRTVEGRLDDVVAEARGRLFDLARGPLARVEVIHGDEGSAMVFGVHHIVADGAAMQILMRDLYRAYYGNLLTAGSDRTELAAYARQSWELADGPQGERLRAFWRDALADAAEARPLTVHLCHGPPTFLTVPISAELEAELRRAARELRVTFFTMVLGAAFVTLRQHMVTDDLIISTPYHGRRGRARKGLVGSFANILPIRQRMDDADTYETLLRTVAADVRAGIAHGDLPLPAILRAAGLVGPQSRTRTHEVVLTYWDETLAASWDTRTTCYSGARPEAAVSVTDTTSASDYRLTILLEEDGTGCRLTWQDPGHTIDPALVTAMAEHHLAVLEDMRADPRRALGDAPSSRRSGADGRRPDAAQPQRETAEGRATESNGPRPVGRPETVRVLAEIWCDVLGVPAATAADSFFELGGHSLLAATLVERMSTELCDGIGIRDLFGHPVLGELAAVIDERRGTAAAVAARSQGPGPAAATGTSFPASRFQEGIWLAERLDPTHARYHVPLLWHVEGDVTPDRLRQALALLVARHEILRTRFVDRDGALFQEVTEAWAPEVGQGDLSGLSESDREHWLGRWSDTAVGGLDPSHGQLLRAGLFGIGGGRQVLSLCAHHLVLDGESVPLLVRELESCYGAPLAASQASRHQYRDLVAAQGAGRSEADLEYWRDRLAGAPVSLGLPEITPPGPHGSAVLPVKAATAAALAPVRLAHKVSTFMIEATAVAAALHQWTGREDLTFGTPVSQRGTTGLDVIGPCLNTLVVRSHCGERTTVAELLAAVREEIIGAFERQRAPFEDVVRQLRPPRSAGATPYVDVMVNNVSLAGWRGRLGSARLTPVDFIAVGSEVSKFPLCFTFAEAPGAVQGTLSFRGDRITPPEAESIAERTAEVLGRFAELLDTPVRDIAPQRRGT